MSEKVCLLLGMQHGSVFCDFMSVVLPCARHTDGLLQMLISLLRVVFESCSAILSVASAVGVGELGFVPRAAALCREHPVQGVSSPTAPREVPIDSCQN